MNKDELRVLKRSMMLSELESGRIDTERGRLIKALKGDSDWISSVIYCLIGVGFVMILNYIGFTWWLETWLR